MYVVDRHRRRARDEAGFGSTEHPVAVMKDHCGQRRRGSDQAGHVSRPQSTTVPGEAERSGFGRAWGISVGRAAAEGEGEDEDEGDRLDAEASENA